MNERDFCYWLQGYLELTPGGAMTAEQVDTIRRHLQLVFTKLTTPVPGQPHLADLIPRQYCQDDRTPLCARPDGEALPAASVFLHYLPGGSC